MSRQATSARGGRVFNSVFGSGDISQPTPVATSVGEFPAPGVRWGVPPTRPAQLKAASKSFSDHLVPELSSRREPDSRHDQPVESKHVQDQVRWDRSWHTVTHALALSPFPRNQNAAGALKPLIITLDEAFYQALEDVLSPSTRVSFACHTEDLAVWHTQQVRSHFLNQVLPIIHRLKKQTDRPDELVSESVEVLETAHRQYLHGIGLIKTQLDSSAPGRSLQVWARFRRDLHAVISNSVLGPLSSAVRRVLDVYVRAILGLPANKSLGAARIAPEGRISHRARQELLTLVEALKNVGLAGEKFQVIFAEIMHSVLESYVKKGFKGIWSSQSSGERQDILPRAAHLSSPSQCTTEICEWIENRYAQLIVQVLSLVDSKLIVTWANKEKYKEIGIGHLAELRIGELFDIVINWPNGSGALDDLRTAITTPQRRLHLTEAFVKTLSEKLLHPGTSTLQILQTYISMIWSFHALDHSKVLLDRVAYPLQLYLCSREDTVRIIITGLLADPDDPKGRSLGGDKLVELAQLLNNGNEQVESRSNNEELDWHDMDWVPEPVDAGPGYKRSRNADIIGTLIGTLGASDVFIKEFQHIIGDNLLKHDGGFEREIKVLELLKPRFGEASLQACEVMLKDIQDSSRVNSVIRRDRALEPSEGEINDARSNPNSGESPEGLRKPSLHAKILSRLFWPQLQDDRYRIPHEVASLQQRYEAGFETLKSARKLTWLHTLGQATVELELEDRKILEEVHTWQATVIWAFQSEAGIDPVVTRTVDELMEALEMEEPLVRGALKFWVNKLVLHETTPGIYTVLETLNQEDRARSNAQTGATFSAEQDESAVVANENIVSEKMMVYWQYIQGMLKNSSSQMPLPQIAMMLKMFNADGFPYSNEELQELLSAKVAVGELELNGGKYKLKK
ncbi:hypothetical protein BJ875DRAFT_450400 [Amylocarpus encephaloides]|uniref:Anaphase-promoting complex subunit 2 n=1 Tax=Amylocarpus encephaloides TaxID=45428 RepID=A0A9P7YRY7_9HELO|nr:hypothetical protein BJ875DRAFT_450400 [Amylocarpus encephaloides]